MTSSLSPTEHADPPVTKLVRDAVDETRELVQLEMALAKEEWGWQVRQAKRGGIVIGIAVSLAIAGVVLGFCAIALACSTPWLAALVECAALMSLSAVVAFAGWSVFPHSPLTQTKERLASDAKGLKERIS